MKKFIFRSDRNFWCAGVNLPAFASIKPGKATQITSKIASDTNKAMCFIGEPLSGFVGSGIKVEVSEAMVENIEVSIEIERPVRAMESVKSERRSVMVFICCFVCRGMETNGLLVRLLSLLKGETDGQVERLGGIIKVRFRLSCPGLGWCCRRCGGCVARRCFLNSKFDEGESAVEEFLDWSSCRVSRTLKVPVVVRVSYGCRHS